jgi:putative transcriptional regulator
VRSGFCRECKRHRFAPLYALLPLCLLLLLGGACWPTSAADAGPRAEGKHRTAILLVAQEDLSDSDFADSVVLVVNNVGFPAPVGVIVNRPTPITVGQLVARFFPHFNRSAALQGKVYFGGPVELDSVWFLFRAARAPEHAKQAFDGVYLSDDRDLLLKLLARDKPMEGLKIFIGHSGWAPDQLQAEIARGDWTVKDAESNAIFNSKPEHPWPAPQNQQHAT